MADVIRVLAATVVIELAGAARGLWQFLTRRHTTHIRPAPYDWATEHDQRDIDLEFNKLWAREEPDTWAQREASA